MRRMMTKLTKRRIMKGIRGMQRMKGKGMLADKVMQHINFNHVVLLIIKNFLMVSG